MDIRRLTIEDVKTYKEIRFEALKKHPEAFDGSYEEEILYSDEKFRNILTESHVFGAFDSNKIVAVGGFFIQTPKKLSHRATFWGMYVRPEKRGCGVGKKILDKIIEASSQQAVQIHCSVLVGNEPATKLYEKCGFKIYGTDPRHLKIRNEFYDEYMIVRILDKRSENETY